jgi:hypothetical protein
MDLLQEHLAGLLQASPGNMGQALQQLAELHAVIPGGTPFCAFEPVACLMHVAPAARAVPVVLTPSLCTSNCTNLP